MPFCFLIVCCFKTFKADFGVLLVWTCLCPSAQGGTPMQDGVWQQRCSQPAAEVMCPVSSQQLVKSVPVLEEPATDGSLLSTSTEGNSVSQVLDTVYYELKDYKYGIHMHKMC